MVLLSIFAALLITSCSNTPNGNLIGARLYYSHAVDSILDTTIARHNRLLNIPLADPSQDTTDYRIWYGDLDTLRMVHILSGARQQCVVYTTIHEKRNDSMFLIVKSIEKKNPAAGWENLLHTMDTLKIDSIADIRSLVKENVLLWEEAPNYVVEVYHNKRRDSCFFIRPYCYNDLWQGNNFSKLLNLLESRLKVNVPATELRNCHDSLIHQPVEYNGEIY